MKKKWIALWLCVVLAFSGCGGSKQGDESANTNSTVEDTTESQSVGTEEGKEPALKVERYATMTPQEVVASLTLEQKAAQMVLPAIYNVNEEKMRQNCYGAILSKSEALGYTQWQKTIAQFQKAALESDAGIPMLYGQDDLHGVNYASGTVLFPHNIGMGAANDPELMYQVGLITADEAKLCHMLWNYAPCVAQSVDPRWGRTYESYGADLDMITSLSTAYCKGLIDGGVVACPKHFFADGNVVYGTGEKSEVQRLIDRGDAVLSDEEIEELLSVYQALVDTGVQTIMITHSSVNGVKMHENAKYIQYLKNEMGFEGFIVSDWDSVQNTSAPTYKEQVINAINAGIDMLMEVSKYDEAKQIIVDAVKNGEISEERVNDAVTRIIKVKMDEGIFKDPYNLEMQTVQTKTGSDEYRAVAEKAVEESLVLLKNENDLLPLKEGMKIFVMGPACNNAQVQCGGWTIDWNSSPKKEIMGATTIKKGFEQVCKEKGIELLPNLAAAKDADVIVLVVGEEAYAEWNGDTEDLALCGALGLSGNEEAMKNAKELGKPIVTLVVAGRQVLIEEYMDDWDSVVMCYLPGSEGQGVARVVCGDADFTGKLPSPWYSSIEQIGTGNCWLPMGYGLTY